MCAYEKYDCRYRVKNRLEVVKTRRRMEKTKEAASISREGKMVPKLGEWQWCWRGQGILEIISDIFRSKNDIGLRLHEQVC